MHRGELGGGAGKPLGLFYVGDEIPFKDSSSYITWLDAHLFERLRGWVKEKKTGWDRSQEDATTVRGTG